MSSPLLDRIERTRITTELERSLLVEAGAGSGKTHEMAARMAAGVAAGVYDIEQMAAVTFTRKAAAELRGRFQLALEEELARTEGRSSERATNINHALANVERFFAGTIHAFCARLLRERPVEAGVSPGFAELDDVQDRLLRHRSWRDYRAQARAGGNRDLVTLDEAGIHAKDLDDAFETVCVYEDVDFTAADVSAPEIDGAWTALGAFWREIESRLPDPVPADTTCGVQRAAVRFRRDWQFVSRRERTPAALADLLRTWDFATKVTQYVWARPGQPAKPAAEFVKARHEAFRNEIVTPYLTAWRQYLYAPCVRVLMEAREHAAAERRRHNVLSFNDLLLLTARLLREHAGVRESLQRKYRHLFVDEFQDTDPVQAEIMLLLAGSTGTLFVVGDPKQSIYRFRRADIDVYNAMRVHLGGADGSGVVSLTTNFRSVPAICDWANGVFSKTFPSEPDTWQPKFAPLVPKPGVENTGSAIWTLTVEDTFDTSAAPEEEARRIARYIQAEVAAGRRRYEDFLILTRKKKRLLGYARALEDLHVPIEVSGAGAFGESREVRDLAAMLGALADPQDSVALVGVLRGPLFGLSDPQLFAYRQAGGYLGLFSEAPASAADDAQPVTDALEMLRRWFRWTRLLPAGAALDRILEDSGYLALAATSPGGVEAGDLLHAVDRVRAAVEAGFTLAEAAESIEEDADESSEVESLPLEPGRGGVVRLMNLHKAKGLEAPVVFLADPLGGFDPKVDVRVVRRDDTRQGTPGTHAAVGYFPITQPYGQTRRVVAAPPDWSEHEAEERRYLNAEAGRLLYVAATRAKDMLVVGRYAKSGGRGTRAWAAFEEYLKGMPELVVPAQVAAPAAAAIDLSEEEASRAAEAIEAAHARVQRATWAATSVTAEAKRFPRITPVAGDDDGAEDDPTRVLVKDTPSRRADAGVEWGSLVHGLLEHAMRHPSATRDDLRRLALWLTVEHPSLRVVIEQAIDTAQAIVSSDLLQEARLSSDHHEEVPFSVASRSGDMPMVLSGTIDLVYRTGDGWRIVDYKTDVDAAAPALGQKYAEQVAAYERAWSSVTSESVASQVISARMGER